MIKKNRMFFDIETSFNQGWFWHPGKQVVRSDQILHERKIICICWKWEGQSTVHHLTWDKNQSDKAMLKEFLKELNKADEIIAHNGDNFDMKWLRTRCLKHKIEMFPTYRTTDTMKLASAGFNFNSKGLNYIANYLGVGEKMATGGIGLWKDIILKNKKTAMNKMVRYCKQDVEILEAVYNELKTYTPHKLHYGVLNKLDKSTCPECGSVKCNLSKTYSTKAGTLQHSMRCYECKKCFTVNSSIFKNWKKGT